jgi:putative phosphoribosyl transferase
MTEFFFWLCVAMFRDRKEAGQKLGKALRSYRKSDGIVLAIPRGGVEVGITLLMRLCI